MTLSPSTPAEGTPERRDVHTIPGGNGSVGRALLRAMRPRQWAKNLLVLAAPVIGGGLQEPRTLLLALVGLVTFTMASAGVYLVNDLVDVDLDRAHPTKRLRPIASGALPAPVARIAAVVLLVTAPLLGALATWKLSGILALYVALSIGYCLRLKAEPVIELAIVASGFLLRALAGGWATGTDLSHWFILTAGFGSLFVAAGKRYAERHRADENDPGRTRPVLAAYSTSYLRFVWTLSAAAVCLTYAEWALSRFPDDTRGWSIASLVPFLLALLRYAVDVDRGNGGEPEEIILRSRPLLLLGAIWAVTLVVSMYV